MPVSYWRHIGPSGRQLAYALGMIALIGAIPLAADYAPKGQQPAAQKGQCAGGQPSPRDFGTACRQTLAQPNKQDAKGARSPALPVGTLSDLLIVLFTAVLTYVAILQHRLESRTASETRDALKIAKLSADAAAALAKAAAAANELTRQQFLEQHRPRITATTIDVRAAEVKPDGSLSVGIAVRGKNAGNVPGSDVSAHFKVAPLADHFEPGLVIADLTREVIEKVVKGWPLATTLNAGDEAPLISLHVVIPASDVAALITKPDVRFSAAGMIHYTYNLPPVPKNSMFWVVVTYVGDREKLSSTGPLKTGDFELERIAMFDFVT